MASRSALITGLSGMMLSDGERAFLAQTRPAGIILFARNIESHEQIRRIVGEARAAIGANDTLVLIDQEGGRVQRLRPPLGRALPPASAYASLYRQDPEAALSVAWQAARLLAEDLRALDIDTDCAPVLDLPVAGAHAIIGDRAYGDSVEQVVRLGRAVAEGFMAGGVVPVIKHIPGHGRATADSHLTLPVVGTDRATLEATDFAPFRQLADMPAAMTAHVVYSAIDATAPASTSRTVMDDVIRGHIGFDGFLMSDDLGMQALTGDMRARARDVIAAGCDVALHCSGVLVEMWQAAEGVPELAGEAMRRFGVLAGVRARCEPYGKQAAQTALESLLNRHAASIESV